MATRHEDRARDFSARAAFVYLAAASAWILLSDWLVEFFDLPESLNPQTVKGLLFVLVTGLVLYLTVHRWAGRAVRYWERALQAEEHRLAADRMVSAMFDASPLAGMVLDPDGTVLLWSPAAVEMFGWTAEEAVGTRNPVVPDDKLDEFDELRRRAREDGPFIGMETVRRRKDGSRLHVSISAAPLRVADGHVYAVASFIEDITVRKEAQAALAESEERFRAVVEQTEQGIVLVRADGTVVVYNDAMRRVSGYTRDEVERDGWLDLVRSTEEADVEASRAALEALEGGASYVEMPIMRGDRHRRWVSLATTHVEIGGERYDLTIVTDTHERRVAEERVRASEERFRLLAENLPGVVYVGRDDADMTMLYFNDRMAGLTGLSDAGLSEDGFRFAEVCHPDDLPPIRAEIARAKAEGRPFELRYRIVRPDGSVRWAEGFGDVLEPDDEDDGLLEGVIFDVTVRIEHERELETYRLDLEELVEERTSEVEEANLAKSRFLAAMSHELRTPLNSVIGFSGILQQELVGTLTEEQHRQVGMIQQSGRHLLALINDILDLSKIEAGKIEVHADTFDVLGLAREAVDVMDPLAGEGLSLSVESEEDTVTVRSDEAKVREILLNLASNAVKFTDEGAVTVHVRSTDTGARIAVEDTGIGIPEDELPDLFDPFVQVETRAGTKAQGTGLGLAICKEYADMIGGTIRVRSEPGVGSTFTLDIPDID
jgi:PAS domain S-box-containing protein